MVENLQAKTPSNSLDYIRQSLWCGAVCGLAVVFTSLNFLPPIDVQYKVTSQVLVGQTRLDRLQAELENEKRPMKPGEDRFVQLVQVKTLDEANSESLILVEVQSLWNARTAERNISAWLERISKPDPRVVIDTEAAREDRFARWQAATARHYLDQYKYISAGETPTTSPQVANSNQVKPRKPTTRLASTTVSKSGRTTAHNASTTHTVSSDGSDDDMVLQLTESVSQAETAAQRAAQKFKETFTRHAGGIELVGAPDIRTKTSRIPGWMTLSILVLALASGSIASLLQLRTRSVDAYDPNQIAARLSSEGVPVVGQLELKSTPTNSLYDRHPITQAIVSVSSRHLMTASEWMLVLWCVLIALRTFSDPLWRSVAFENPLAAFGRLMAGMP